MAAAARRAVAGRHQSASSGACLETAQNRVAEKIDEIEQLEIDLEDAIIEIDDEWSAKASSIEDIEIPLEKTDITIEDLILIWLPSV